MDWGLLILRLVIGLSFMAHGAQKLFGWFGGYGVKGTGQWLDSIGMKPGALMAVVAGLLELLGGFFFASGWLTVVGSIFIILMMLAAIAKVHAKNGYWVTAGGFEYNLTLIAAAVAVALTGPGAFALGA
ncbi:DoxX family protein [Paenibacillus filicis]|uniref:DoxX family protein n=1 Tax=Paenibacillus gyeongsangnamensis TaxID=3388067 RepID=A0ABT4QFN4_9BACL|nr:DoxX family protein [Paenibacillus filicis]MCZ8515678.1 DoxX family protein [Paenibacillus filicis]